eukprot:11352486-Alexandrium_andersonii.AAC.1
MPPWMVDSSFDWQGACAPKLSTAPRAAVRQSTGQLQVGARTPSKASTTSAPISATGMMRSTLSTP